MNKATPPRRHTRQLSVCLLTCLLLMLGACAQLPGRSAAASWVPSPNHDVRAPQLIVLHYTQQDSVAESLHTLRTANSGGPVSAHYLVGQDGHIYQLVSDLGRAWHAGGGRWGTITDVNSGSLGIEIDNDGSEPFTRAQIASVIALLTDLTARWPIPCSAIIGHQDMAPRRKPDPGPLFPWGQLAAAGFGLWPDPPAALRDPPAGFDAWLALTAIGYPLDDRPATVRAFHNHYRGTGGETLDAEDLRILHNLTGKLGQPGTCTRTAP